MKKCPNCGWSPEDDIEPTTADEFNPSFMDRIIKKSAERMKREMGYGIPDKKKDVIKFNKPKVFKGELDHVERKS